MTHWTEGLIDVSGSVRQRLRNVAKATGENMQVVLIRYATERLMYRLSRSRYRDAFVLKGAWLFYVWGIPRRETRDVDFLAAIDNATDNVSQIFRQIVEVEVPHDDGLTFDAQSFQVEEIQLDGDYSGVRLRMIAMLGRTEIHTQIDLGFSEALVEEPVITRLPVLLDYDPPEIRAYSPEVVIAEKIEAIVKLGVINTRFKDFFDLYVLSHERSFDAEPLAQQIVATFAHRGTPLPTDVPVALTSTFAADPETQAQWRAFVRRSEADNAPPAFADVTSRVRGFVYPVLDSAVSGGFSLGTWRPAGGWVVDEIAL